MMLKESDITLIEEKIEAAKTLLDEVAHIADGKNGNVILLAHSKRDDLDIIVKCAKIRTKA